MSPYGSSKCVCHWRLVWFLSLFLFSLLSLSEKIHRLYPRLRVLEFDSRFLSISVGNYIFRHSVNFEVEYLYEHLLVNDLVHDEVSIQYGAVPHAVFSHPQIARYSSSISFPNTLLYSDLCTTVTSKDLSSICTLSLPLFNSFRL